MEIIRKILPVLDLLSIFLILVVIFGIILYLSTPWIINLMLPDQTDDPESLCKKTEGFPSYMETNTCVLIRLKIIEYIVFFFVLALLLKFSVFLLRRISKVKKTQ